MIIFAIFFSFWLKVKQKEEGERGTERRKTSPATSRHLRIGLFQWPEEVYCAKINVTFQC